MLRNETEGSTCTLGYFVKYQGRVSLVSAGHCYTSLQSAWDNVYQPNVNSDIIADMTVAVSDDRRDFLIAPLRSEVYYATAVINIIDFETYNIIWFQDYLSINDISTPMKVYKTGKSSGTTSGYIIYADMITYRIYFTASSLEGDSGAPIYTVDGTLIGHLVGETTYYAVGYSVSLLEDYGAEICAQGCPP